MKMKRLSGILFPIETSKRCLKIRRTNKCMCVGECVEEDRLTAKKKKKTGDDEEKE